MSTPPRTQAILLLTSHLSKPKKDSYKPLTPREWGRFSKWLKDSLLVPEDLLSGKVSEKLSGWSDEKISIDRLESLISRGASLSIAMEKWLRAGLWVLTRSDPDYPDILKDRLGLDSPALLFGSGNRSLLKGGGLAVVGSRKISEDDLNFSKILGQYTAKDGHSIVSGGAKGVDETAMLGALEVEGTVIGVLADSLLRASLSAKYREHLVANNLVLVSPFYPEAGFNVGNAMQRNKYIYCLSNAAFVVQSGTSGGTWNGALENIKKKWVPLWVRKSDAPSSGNEQIVQKGANWESSNPEDINFQKLFDLHLNKESNKGIDSQETPESSSEIKLISEVNEKLSDKIDSYEDFIKKIKPILENKEIRKKDLFELLEIEKKLFDKWIKIGVENDKIIKLTRPVRYIWSKQVSLFDLK